ncbi:hypothetical protein [Enterocloster bolteae]|uniref:hypothetical protein n=1 Tax=Enterocloster bolteae TaxID=208479 RepID=UPI002A8394F0|nr:hypothetical protein [Enterocloster bolteae]
MSNEKMFEIATRSKFRFPYKGQISVEDMWELSLPALDSVFKTLNAQIKQIKEESLLSTKSKADETLELQIEIVKYIVSVKLAEKEAREKAAVNKEMKQKIMQIKAARQDKALLEASDEDLDKLLAELGE